MRHACKVSTNISANLYNDRSSLIQLGLFVPWEQFLSISALDLEDVTLSSLWQHSASTLQDRLAFYAKNIELLRFSKEDAAQDRANVDDEDDDSDGQGYYSGPEVDDDQDIPHAVGVGAVLEAFQDALEVSPPSLFPGPVVSDTVALFRHGADSVIEDGLIRERPNLYQDLRQKHKSPLSDYIIDNTAVVKSLAKTQKQLSAARSPGISAGVEAETDNVDDSSEHYTYVMGDHVDCSTTVTVEIGPATTFSSLGLDSARTWTLNGKQAMALQLITAKYDEVVQNEDVPQFLCHIGGPGGTGKSHILKALRDVLKAKGHLGKLVLSGSTGRAGASIGGKTIHSLCKFSQGHDSEDGNARIQRYTATEADKLGWKSINVLVIDEISMVPGFLLHDINTRLQMFRECKKAFGGIAIVLLFGDFYQFPPVSGQSLLYSKFQQRKTNDGTEGLGSQREKRIDDHERGHQLFKRFTTVIMLDEQVRAAKCPRLLALIHRFRHGKQTPLDEARLKTRAHRKTFPRFEDGLRVLVPRNHTRCCINMAAAMSYANTNSLHISIFISKHTWIGGLPSTREMTEVIQHGDSSNCKIPGIFVYVAGMPAVLTRNVHDGLNMVNGAEFTAVDVVPDPSFPGFRIADNITLHFGPPLAVLLTSPQVADVEIAGLPKGHVILSTTEKSMATDTMHKSGRSFRHLLSSSVTRTGLNLVPAFSLTDYKSQGSSFDLVCPTLEGAIAGRKCSFPSAYVQLSRARTWDGIWLFNEPRHKDFLGNKLSESMAEGIARLDKLGEATNASFGEWVESHRGRDPWADFWLGIPRRVPKIPDVDCDVGCWEDE